MAVKFEETYRPMGNITNMTNTGIVTPSKHDVVGRLHKCACGIPCNAEKCGVCNAEERAGFSLRVKRVR